MVSGYLSLSIFAKLYEVSDFDKNVRVTAAKALKKMYRKGRLTKKAKQRILEVKGTMARSHGDQHDDGSSCVGHHDHHGDYGIGVRL